MTTRSSDTALLTVDDVALRLNCSPKTVRREIKSNHLESVRIGPAKRLLRIPEWALKKYEAERIS